VGGVVEQEVKNDRWSTAIAEQIEEDSFPIAPDHETG
jgi:hypothetical protein